MIIQCHIDDATLKILQSVSAKTGRTVEDLAESAIAEAALKSDREVSR